MVRDTATPKVEGLDLSDDDTEALFASPSRPETKPPSKASRANPKEPAPKSRDANDGDSDDGEAREAALRKELAGIRTINQVIEGTIDSLQRAQGNMDPQTVSRTVSDASTLLNTWTRILSQTEHNQRLILQSSWQGATQDMADIENESLVKQQEKEKREFEDMQRREARAKKAEEDERRKAENVGAKVSRGTRARGRGLSRGGGSGRSGSQLGPTTSGSGGGSRVARAGSGIGRGNGGRSRGP
ncbi:MAG: hypothetical protein Q9223_000804 [Gallowayella weberi]